ncbi:MAG: WD40 repeat domain-containing protein [Okeania sp. SIO2D1]|nr:WD40 repeat domain-containing protein [Okeania sp. SIO2D1]
MSNLRAWLEEKSAEKSSEEREHFLVTIPRLFLQGGQVNKLCSLLSNYDFIEAKINHHHPECGVEALIKDYDLIDDIDVKLFKYGYQSIKSLKLIQTIKSLKLIQGALRLSRYILIKYPKQLAGQLSGRLLSFDTPEIKKLLQQIPQTQVPCLRSLRASLNPPEELLISTLIGHTDSVNAVAVTPDGKFIISGSSDSTVKVWDLNTGEELLLGGHSSPVNALAVTPDGKKVISGASDNTVIVWNLEKRKKTGTFDGHSHPVVALAITPDGKTVVSASIAKKNSIKVWDLENENCQEKLTLKGHGHIVRTLAITSSNRIISASDNGSIKVWDLTNGKTLFTLQHGHKTLPGFTFVGFESPLSFVTPGFTGWASEAVYTIAVTRDGKRLISASGSGDNNTNSIKVWDLETGKEKSTLEGHKNPISALAITPNDKQVISASFDNTIKIWDIESGKEILTFIGHDNSIYDIAITLDGNKMISGSKDKTIKIWKLDPYNKHIQLTGNDNSVNDITITSDGKQVIFGLQDNTIKFSNLEENNLYDNFYSKYNIQDNILAKTRKILETCIGLSSREYTKIVSVIPIWLFSLLFYVLINRFFNEFLTLGILILLFSILNRLYLFIKAKSINPVAIMVLDIYYGFDVFPLPRLPFTWPYYANSHLIAEKIFKY